MATIIHLKGCTFAEAAELVRPHLPVDVNPACVPEGWNTHLIKGAK